MNSILYKSLIVIGTISIIYWLGLNITFGRIAFSQMFLLVGALLVAYGLIEINFNLNLWGGTPVILRRIIVVLFTIGMITFISIEGLIIYSGFHHDKEKPDYLMILGAGLRGDKLTTTLKYRLDEAIEFNKKFPDVKIIVSGGQGPDEELSEALAMNNYLLSKGIDKNNIIMEDKSTTTYENFLLTKKLLKEITGKDNYTITVVTNNFHMYRAKYLGELVGFNCLVYPAPSHFSSSFNFYIREFFGVIKAYVLKR